MPTYVVRDPASALRQAGVRLFGVGVVVAVVGLGQGRWNFAGVMVLVIVVFGAPSVWRSATLLEVGAHGVSGSTPGRRQGGRPGGRSSRARSAWSTIHRIEVAPSRGVVRVVLRSDVPLPRWVQGRIIDPADPGAGGSWERRVPDLDTGALSRAVGAHAPQIDLRTVSE